MLSPLGPALRKRRGKKKEKIKKRASDLLLRQVFYGFPSVFILFCLILPTGISSTSAWFSTDFRGLSVLNRQYLGTPLSVGSRASGHRTENPRAAGLSVQNTPPHLFPQARGMLWAFTSYFSNDMISLHERSCVSQPHSSSPGIGLITISYKM